MNVRSSAPLQCTRLALSGGLGDMLHRRRCPECRAATEADAMLLIALDCMRSECAPGPGQALPADYRTRVAAVVEAIGVTPRSWGAREVRRLKRAIVRVCAAVLVLAVALPLWTMWLDRDPGHRFALVRVPSPNAFTFFQQAGAETVRDGRIDELALALPNMAEVDALPIYTAMPPASVSAPAYRRQTKRPALAEVERTVDAHATALARLREGLAYPYAEPATASLYEGSAHLEPFRRIARLLALEGYANLKRGRYDDAAASYLDAVRFGIACQHGAPRAGRLVGLFIEGIGRAGLWAAMDDLDARTAARAARRLQDIAAAKPPIREMFAADRNIGSEMIVRATEDPFWRLKGWDALSGRHAGGMPWWAGPVQYILTLPASRPGILQRYRNFISGAEAAATLAYPRTAGAKGYGPFDVCGNTLLLDEYPETVVMNDLDTAQNELLAVALASHAYRRRHGRYASSIGALVDDGLLKRVPTDPFDERRRPIRYDIVLGTPVIYSIGPDGMDTGGISARPDDAELSRISQPLVSCATRGDIVAGKNIGWWVWSP